MRNVLPYIQFRARRKDNGEYVIGSYIKLYRKGSDEYIKDFNTNDYVDIIRETLQMQFTNPMEWDEETGFNKAYEDWKDV